MKRFASPNGAVFSPDRRYRYVLWRTVAPRPGLLAIVALNPSTADELHDDPTIRRCIGFCREWGYGKLCVINLFAWRATDPSELKRAADPVGPQNDRWISRVAGIADRTLAAWGNHGLWRDRAASVAPLLDGAVCLGITKRGAPRHPLYVSAGVKGVRLQSRALETTVSPSTEW